MYAAALIVLAACGGGDAAEETAEPPAAEPAPPAATPPATNVTLPDGVTPEMVTAGRQVFSQICFTCHGANGEGVANLGPPLNDQTWINIDGEYNNIVEVVRTGVMQPKQFPGPMPAMGGLQLTDQQLNEVAAFVYSLSRGG
jgi:mono/diheme cytochrome c family protein